MKYLRDYNSFMKQSLVEIDKNAFIVEKKVLSDFSTEFWNLCIKSKLFSDEEKIFINENLKEVKISIVNEEWDWLDKTINWAKDKGEKILNYITDKIKAVKNGIKDFVNSMISFAKKILTSLLKSALLQASKLKSKISGNAKIKKLITDIDPEKSKNEIEDLKKTFQFWAPGNTAAEAKPSFNKVSISIENKIKSSESEVISSTEKNLTEAEEESKNESISQILNTTKDDILTSFYNLSLIKESDEEVKKEKTVGQKCLDWLLDFLRQDKIDPEAKKGTKILWWGKLFLKVLSTCINPILKIVDYVAKTGSKFALKAVSLLTSALGGPGAFEFVILGSICGTIASTIYDTIKMRDWLLETGGLPEEIFSEIKVWIANIIDVAIDSMPSFQVIKFLVVAFFSGMSLWQLYDEIKSLKGLKNTDDVQVKPSIS